MPPFNLKIRPSEKTDVRRREFIMLINMPPPRGRLRRRSRPIGGYWRPRKLANANTNSRKEAIRSIIDGIDVDATEPIADFLLCRLQGYGGQLVWRNRAETARSYQSCLTVSRTVCE
jgi:hypothetical protein